MGKLIVLEGGDGAGKSTQLELIKDYLTTQKKTFKYIHFPKYGDNEFSEVISKFLRGEFGESNKVNPYFVANIFAMDQFLFAPRLKDLLNKYDVVLLDRYVFSNMAYQGAKYEKESTECDDIIEWIFKFQFEFLEMTYPDLTLYIDIPLHIAEERLIKRAQNDDRTYLKGEKDVHEADMNLQDRVHHNYAELCKNEQDMYLIPSAELSTDPGDNDWLLYSPEYIFNSYRQLILDKLDGI